MKFKTIYDEVIRFWPSEIDISDGKYFKDNNGYSFYALSRAWNKVELEVGGENEWNALMVWSIFTVLHAMSIENFNKKRFRFYTYEINEAIIMEKYLEHLTVDGYEDMLEKYEG
jgi:hypothetical protein